MFNFLTVSNNFLEYWTPLLMIFLGTAVFFTESFCGLRAAYGRYNKNNIGISARLAWFIQESPAFFIPLFLMAYKGYSEINSNFLLLLFFLIHYFNRTFIYTSRIKSEKKVNYLENIFGFVFCAINGLQIGHYHIIHKENNLWEWNFLLGSILFFTGLYINIDSDNRLIRLRNNSKSGYKIPTGGLFEHVSAANYFGECLEWFGFALASWSLPALAFSWFTFANIGPRAYHHHLFYKDLFGKKYPSNRKALIPFIF